MDPRQLSQQLIRIATYLENNPSPDRRRVVQGLESLVLHISADVKRFTQSEFSAAVKGLEALIERLTKVAESTNPQDPDRNKIEEGVNHFQQLLDQLKQEFDGLNVQV